MKKLLRTKKSQKKFATIVGLIFVVTGIATVWSYYYHIPSDYTKTYGVDIQEEGVRGQTVTVQFTSLNDHNEPQKSVCQYYTQIDSESIGSVRTVYYNPHNPRQCKVEQALPNFMLDSAITLLFVPWLTYAGLMKLFMTMQSKKETLTQSLYRRLIKADFNPKETVFIFMGGGPTGGIVSWTAQEYLAKYIPSKKGWKRRPSNILFSGITFLEVTILLYIVYNIIFAELVNLIARKPDSFLNFGSTWERWLIVALLPVFIYGLLFCLAALRWMYRNRNKLIDNRSR